MKWIDSQDLQKWADRTECAELLPLLVRKLIRATSNTIKSIKFPAGNSILLGGWDGVLEVEEETDYLPAGVSLWEFGRNKGIKGKADEDYKKRVNDPLGYNSAESTFIFVTPRLWQKGKDWAEEKKKEGIWKDVRVIDAELLEEWIELAPTVGSWLAKRIDKYRSEGIQPTDDFWEEWTTGREFNLNSEILLGGRKAEQQKVITGLKNSAIYEVQCTSREESLAFIISCFKDEQELEEDFFSRSIIVDNVDAFRELAVHGKPLILIPRFDDNGVVNRAGKNGHTVFLPLGADSVHGSSNKITLPRIERESFISALIKSDLSRELAKRYSKESARNITIFRRQHEFERTMPTWSLPENVSEIIPALLVGRWDESFENDKKIVSQIAGESYEEYSRKLTFWLHTSDSPIVRIGKTWRLASPFYTWNYASRYLTNNNFELLRKSVKEIYSETDPALELVPEERWMASAYGKNREFSSWVREGILQSLILTSIFGEKLKLNTPQSIKAELWVDSIIKELLNNQDSEIWKSFEDKLPLIAEASPTAFLEAIEKLLAVEKSPIVSLFNEDPGFLTNRNYHTGLLWALESLAWFPQYLSRTSLILTELASIDPGGNVANRPINSLSEIFKTWHPQTLASLEERIQILKLISGKEPEIAWIILLSMLPVTWSETALGTYKTRWRLSELESQEPITYKEIYTTHSAVVDMLISIFDKSETKLSILIENSVRLSYKDRDKVLVFVKSVLLNVKHTNHLAWHKCRRILHEHRSHPDAEWVLPESELMRYENLYEVLEPKDSVDNTIWLFNEYTPKFKEGYIHSSDSYNEHKKIICEKRIKGLTSVYQEYGLDKIIELKDKVEQKWILGNILSEIVNEEKEIIRLCELLKEDKSDLRFIQNFIFRKSIVHDTDWVFDLFNKLKKLEFSNVALAKFLTPLRQTQQLWDLVDSTNDEIIQNYWKTIQPEFYDLDPSEKIRGLKKLIEHKRFLSALDVCYDCLKDIPSEIIVEILYLAGTEVSEEPFRMDSYKVGELFKVIDKRNDVENSTIIQLEWLFLRVLDLHVEEQSQIRLQKELSSNPEFFMYILKCIYKSDVENQIEDHENNLTAEQIKSRAELAYKLLDSWKSIPGVNNQGVIDVNILKNWIESVRVIAKNCGRLDVLDSHIGKVLAQYPEEHNKAWPPDELCQEIENLNSDRVNQGFYVATLNKRGVTMRRVFDGGVLERDKAVYYKELAAKHRNRFPAMTRIFENVSKSYFNQAKSYEEDAERRSLEY